MTASIEFFPVGNGDMTLIRLASGKTILIDVNIRNDADNSNNKDCPDVAEMLKERLNRDPGLGNRLYVDVFILTHPDQDHCSGLQKHFYLGAPSTWEEPGEKQPEKIAMHEMWSSPLIFRRLKKADGSLVPDAKAWKDEAKRRVGLAKNKDAGANDLGNMVKIIGQDVNHKTENIEDLVVKVGETVKEICGEPDSSFSALLLSPKIVSQNEADELSGKNNSSVVMQFSISPNKDDIEAPGCTQFLTGGDAEVDIWKRIWGRSEKKNLAYNILQTPHHCSLGALSYDSYNDQNGKKGKGEDCEIDQEAYSALSQAEAGAYLIASSEEPEEHSGKGLAKKKYKGIAEQVRGEFLCTMEESKDRPLKLNITEDGANPPDNKGPVLPVPEKPKKGSTETSYA